VKHVRQRQCLQRRWRSSWVARQGLTATRGVGIGRLFLPLRSAAVTRSASCCGPEVGSTCLLLGGWVTAPDSATTLVVWNGNYHGVCDGR
jgi:hypothetical protein